MAGYAKIWTDIYNDQWFLSLNNGERGFWLQLIVWAKLVGDTGRIFAKSWNAISTAFACHWHSARRYGAKMQTDGKIKLTENADGTIEIEIINYKAWQSVRDPRLRKNTNNSPPRKIAESSQKCRPPDQTRPDHKDTKPAGFASDKKTYWQESCEGMVNMFRKAHPYLGKLDRDTLYQIAGKVLNIFDRDIQVTKKVFVENWKALKAIKTETDLYKYLYGTLRGLKDRGDYGPLQSRAHAESADKSNVKINKDPEKVGQILDQITNKQESNHGKS